MELFKLAAKEKYRFPFRGNISVEDLFDLTTSQLDVVYKELKSQVKESSDSLLKEVSTEDKELKNKIEIVKTIFEDKMTEATQKEQALAEKQRKERIKAVSYTHLDVYKRQLIVKLILKLSFY